MTLTAPVRLVEGLELPVSGQYEIDPGHSTVGFEVRHLMLTRTRGLFRSFSGTLDIAEDVSHSSVDVTIDAASIDTANPERDDHLRAGDFLGAEKHPQLTFHSTLVLPNHDRLLVHGDLMIRGITRPVTLKTKFEGGMVDPWGNDRIAFKAGAVINREHWGMTWNIPMDGSGLVVGKEVRLILEVEAVRTNG